MIYFISNQKLQLQSDSIILLGIDEAISHFKKLDIIEVDTETTGLQYLYDKVLLLQLGNKNNQYVFDLRSVNILALKEILEDKSRLKILQNASFDFKFLKKLGITLNNMYDTALVERMITTEPYSKLDQLAFKYLQVELDKDIRMDFTFITNFTEKHIIYAANDVRYLSLIRDRQLPIIQHYKLENWLKVELKLLEVLPEIEYEGIKLDVSYWQELDKSARDMVEKTKLQLDNIIMDSEDLSKYYVSVYQLDLFDEAVKKLQINYSSPQQVLKLFRIRFPELESTNQEIISKGGYSNKEPIKTYLQYKDWSTRVSKYGIKFLENLDKQDRIHTSFDQLKDTGRLGSANPNMQNIPGTNEYRNAFIPNYDDWVFVSSDYSSQELALIAHDSQDETWLNALSSGQDLHSVNAELLFGDEWKNAAESDCAFYAKTQQGYAKEKCSCPRHKKLRTAVKTLDFGLSYGMSATKLADTLEIEEESAQQMIDDFFEVFPKVKESLDYSANFATHNGYIRTMSPVGSIRFFPEWDDKSTPFAVKGQIEREGKNTKIQGTGAMMTKIALIYIHDYIQKNNYPAKIVMTVHDQIDTIVRKSHASEWKNIVTRHMEKAGQLFIPSGFLKADTSINDKWTK